VSKVTQSTTPARWLMAQLQKNQLRHRPNPSLTPDTQRLAREVSELLKQAVSMPTKARSRRRK
jgi:hypothetical protein